MSLGRVLESAQLISQGAEAKVYRGYLTDHDLTSAKPVLLKHRFHKNYRHPALSTQLTRARITSEARSLARCARGGVRVPQVVLVDIDSGIIGIEWIDGKTVRFVLGTDDELMEDEADEGDTCGGDASGSGGAPSSGAAEYGISQDALMQLIGRELGRMHRVDIIHGDLTTSNMFVRRTTASTTSATSATSTNGVSAEIVLIDFGLSFQSTLVEDKAVDLYVLERAFASTHPASEPLFAAVLDAYGRELGAKAWEGVRRRLEDGIVIHLGRQSLLSYMGLTWGLIVRLRGRKRSMVG